VSTRTPCRLAAGGLLLAVFAGGCARPQATDPGAADAARTRDAQPVPTASFLEPCEPARDSKRVTGGLPSVTLRCLGPGPAVDPAALRDRPTVVNLWATWCLPCQKEMPALQRIHERFGDQVRFLGVDSRDDAGRAVEFLRTVGVTYAQTVDPDGELLRQLGIPGLPVTVVLDSDGRVAHQKIGEITESELTAKIRAVM
jgi:cytochrome c biogenesis protein CcmG/thiol:disulfide interchange protein DsbE